MASMITAKELNRRWNVGAVHPLYSEWGNYYGLLRKFPGALFDRKGYVLFATEQEYRDCPDLAITRRLNVKKTISAIPGYVQVIKDEVLNVPDLDIHRSSGVEGDKHLRLHLYKERDRKLVKRKKESAKSLDCEVCGFSFSETYGEIGGSYCEVHHLIPILRA